MNWQSITNRLRPYRRQLLWGGAALLIAVGVVSMNDNGIDAKSLHMVQKHDIVFDVIGRGQLAPEKVIPIKSSLSGNAAKLTWLAPDGVAVSAGDTIARFDREPYIDALNQAEQRMEDTRAAVLSAEKTLIVLEEEESKKIDNAKRELDVAKLKSQDMLSGMGRLTEEKLTLELAQAERALEIVQQELADYDVLLTRGHVSERERAKAADNVRRLEEQHYVKSLELKNYQNFEWPKIKREAEILAESAEATYRRAIRLSNIEISRAKDVFTKAQRDLARAEKSFQQAEANLRATVVTAPIDGSLYYQTLPRPEGARKIQVGDNVWSGQTIMQIPDTQQMVLAVAVREFDVSKLAIGQSAEVSLDAYPNQILQGRVAQVRTIAEREANSGLNQFEVIVLLDSNTLATHVGMSGKAVITVGEQTDVVAVPLEFVHRGNGENWVWKASGSSAQKHYIELGQANHAWQIVERGLSEGDAIKR